MLQIKYKSRQAANTPFHKTQKLCYNKPMKLNKDKIKFTCEKCGDCCRVDGHVFLKKGEIEAMALHCSKPLKEFKKTFTEWLLFKGRVIRHDTGGCAFLVDGTCVVYPARPAQCREFPFWKHVLNDIEEWEYLKTVCRGVRAAKMPENPVS
jgi:Fe-S-cluster containining protein